METTPSPFDLNRAIQKWRENLDQSPAFRRENLDELESHLRDSVAVLQQRELSAEESFMIATKRAGTQATLRAEFGKINGQSIWLDRLLWMLVGILIWWIEGRLVNFASSSMIVFGFRHFNITIGTNNSSMWGVALLASLTNLLIAASLIFVCWSLFKRHQKSAIFWLKKNSQSTAQFASIATLGILAMVLSNVLEQDRNVLMMRYMYHQGYGFFVTGLGLGQTISSLIEVSVIVLLTLWLARRQLLAKTSG